MRKYVIVLAVFPLLWTAPTWAEIVAYNYYHVSGDTLEEVWNDIQQNGPLVGGEHRPGRADVVLNSSFVEGEPLITTVEDKDCPEDIRFEVVVLRNITWRIETTITLPTWIGYGEACDEVKEEWDRFISALRGHEEGHDTIAENALENANPLATISSDKKSDCDPDTAVHKAWDDADEKYDAECARLRGVVAQASDQHDTDTDHGATQGATLDTSITCPEEPEEQIDELIDDLEAMEIPKGVKNSLKKKLEGAKNSLEKENKEAAKGKLKAFINEVNAQKGKKIQEEDAEKLIEEAQEILESIK